MSKYLIYNQTHNLYAGEPDGDNFKSVSSKEEAHRFNSKENAESLRNILSMFVYCSSCQIIVVDE